MRWWSLHSAFERSRSLALIFRCYRTHVQPQVLRHWFWDGFWSRQSLILSFVGDRLFACLFWGPLIDARGSYHWQWTKYNGRCWITPWIMVLLNGDVILQNPERVSGACNHRFMPWIRNAVFYSAATRLLARCMRLLPSGKLGNKLWSLIKRRHIDHLSLYFSVTIW